MIAQVQAKLKAQQSMLQKRLQQALQMHLQPRTSVNTESPADKTLRLLDSLLQVILDFGMATEPAGNGRTISASSSAT